MNKPGKVIKIAENHYRVVHEAKAIRPGRRCAYCNRPIGKDSKSGYCRRCVQQALAQKEIEE